MRQGKSLGQSPVYGVLLDPLRSLSKIAPPCTHWLGGRTKEERAQGAAGGVPHTVLEADLDDEGVAAVRWLSCFLTSHCWVHLRSHVRAVPEMNMHEVQIAGGPEERGSLNQSINFLKVFFFFPSISTYHDSSPSHPSPSVWYMLLFVPLHVLKSKLSKLPPRRLALFSNM